MNQQNKRRDFLKQSTLLAGAGLLGTACSNTVETSNEMKTEMKAKRIIGHGDYTYRVNKEWGVLDPTNVPVQNCHEMVQDAQGRLILATDHVKNNIIIYDRSGKVLDTWTLDLIGAHGLTIATEGEEQFLFITDSELNKVVKTTLDGKVLFEINYPKEIATYEEQAKGNERTAASFFKPTEVAVAPNGDFYVADGYGLDYIIRYDSKGNYISHFGGKGDDATQLQNAHGVTLDTRNPNNVELLVTSRAKQEFKRFSLDGEHLETIPTPGCWICRPVIQGEELYFPVIVTKTWGAYDGLVIVLDKNNTIISAPGGSAPVYKNGILQPIEYDGLTFLNPHDVCIDNDKNIYVPQWYSGKTYPIMLERV